MKKNIVTAVEFLHIQSTPASVEEAPQIIEDLKDSLTDGVGLAAPQIGISKQIFIAKLSTGLYSFINPIIAPTLDSQSFWSTESCLSLPGIRTVVRRQSKVEIADQTGVIMQLSGLDAVIVQHEYDHLKGIILTDSEIYKHNLEVQERAKKKAEAKAAKHSQKKEKKPKHIPQKISARREREFKEAARRAKNMEKKREVFNKPPV